MSHALAVIPYPSLDPVIVRVGFLTVRWYGLAYLAGFALAFVALRRMARRGVLFIPADEVGELVSRLAFGVLLGGRLGWWLFYHRGQGAAEPWYEPIAIWHGGMSFHGGLVGVLVALLAWSWRRRAPFWNLADGLAMVAPVGLFFGRLANFINAELVGRSTTMPWGMIFPGDTVPRHPSQLYEAFLEGPLLLAVVWVAASKLKLRPGQTASLFVFLYGVFRFAVEFTRQPDAQLGFIAFGWLTMGQLLSAALALAGAALLLALGRAPTGARQHLASRSENVVSAAEVSGTFARTASSPKSTNVSTIR